MALIPRFDAAYALAPSPRVRGNDATIDCPRFARARIDDNDDGRAATHTQSSRREALKRAFLVSAAPVVAATASAMVLPPIPAAVALESCGPKSHNCIRTTWTAPASIAAASEVAKAVREVLDSYPMAGQAGVDCGGWRIANDALLIDGEEDSGLMALEYKSCVGPAALAINLGRPFVDDLKLELGKGPDGRFTVDLKSSSRMGSSDLFVNRKRLQYLGSKLKERGWDVPYPKYVYEM